MAQDINMVVLLSFLVFLVPIYYVTYKLKLGIIKNTTISILRMTIQLYLVGVYLKYIFEWNNPFINMGYFILMIVAASFSVIKNSNINFKCFFIPVLLSTLVPNIFILLYLNYFVVNLDNIFNAVYVIPLGGMLLGNTLKGNIIAISSFLSDIKNNEKEYFYKIMLGANKLEATLPYIRKSMVVSLNPTIANMATVGLVSLPGMMTGQILGGSSPIVAIKYQIAIMLGIFISQFIASLFCIYLILKMGFDKYNLLKENAIVEK
ncbi:MAG: ABC transporter permease [Fusobacteria bacterium]|nr:ABC transporter permease [Fusobacteriota bacterium]